MLAHDALQTVASAKELSARAKRSNLFIKIPGTQEGLPAIENSIFAGEVNRLDPIVRTLEPGAENIPRTLGRERLAARRSSGIFIADRMGPGIGPQCD